ncbi:DUF3040 domain-containing protein [Amycolatopsis sp. NBC_01488]|uniref:DUF3040 domain-containing protein n=1 Tax=Amycolatopsis sp. NBC_01488 TaxID=2903563 RepID=UPI002E2E74AD|nr:DUF3040 domain-containing protein [Amycolatopsis sp. NBC_01488]
MLPERERHALREIEAELQASDPAFAAAFDGRSLREAKRWHLLLLLCDITAGVMLVVGLFARDAGLVLWGTVGGGGLVAWHIARAETNRKPTPDGTNPAADSH